jgi:D-hydroxyproline dehydrogenase subunit gamma
MFKQLPIAAVKTINITIDGRPIQLAQEMTVAAAVLSTGQRYTRTTPFSGAKRAPFCMMGVCFECLMVIDGKPNQRACATYVREGMCIESQQGLGPEFKGEVRG